MRLSHSFASCFCACLPPLACLAMLVVTNCCQANEPLLQQSPSDLANERRGLTNVEESDIAGDGRLPSVVEGRFQLPELAAVSTSTENVVDGDAPHGFRGQGQASPLQQLPESGFGRGLSENWTVCNWAAANTFSHPRYFEDRMLERHGHERFSRIQPLASGMRFFTTIPMLPYLMAVSDPCDCEYTLGYYRPGSCAPVMLQRPPYERQAVIAETAAVAGVIIAFP